MKTISADKQPARKMQRMFRSNLRQARSTWGKLPTAGLQMLKELTYEHHLSISWAIFSCLDSKWYVTHSGLLRIARRHKCSGIKTLASFHPTQILLQAAGYLRPPSIRQFGRKGMSVMETPIPLISLRLFAAPKCAWPRPAQSIVHSGRLMASASAQSKSSAGRLENRPLPSPAGMDPLRRSKRQWPFRPSASSRSPLPADS